MASEGQYAPRTFKSLISQQLIPTICAECAIPMHDWELLSDRVLLEKIEERLKPKNATDVINRLRELTISQDTTKGTLSQRYRLFAESFLQRLAEAQECGCTVTENAIKQTFVRAVRQEPALDSWVSEEKWTNVWDAHRRIVERLRDYDAWAVYANMQNNPNINHVQVPPMTVPPANTQFKQEQRQDTGKSEGGQKRAWDGTHKHQSFINALTTALRTATCNNTQTPQPPPPAQNNQQQGYQQYAPRQYPTDTSYIHPGLDARGPNWHLPTKAIRCPCTPCDRPFCQICGMHGHTSQQCSKRFKRMPGINLHGYYQETKPDQPPVRYQSPLAPQIGQQPLAQQVNLAAPSSPSPYSHPPAAHHQPAADNTQTVRFNLFPHFVNPTTDSGRASASHAPTSTASRTQSVHPERQSQVNAASNTDASHTSQQNGQPSEH
jgi:hypothetical protein